MDRLAEQLEIIRGSFGGRAVLLPRRALRGRGARRAAQARPAAAAAADGRRGDAARRRARRALRVPSTTSCTQTPEEAAAAREPARAACAAVGRDPATLTFSLMHALADRRRRRRAARPRRAAGGVGGPETGVDELRASWVAGTPDEVVARLREYEAAGVERVMLQHLLVRDEAALELFAAEVMPAFA